MKFINDRFDLYDADKFSNAWTTVNDPLMIVFQIGFWVYSYFFTPIEPSSSIIWNIIDALYFGFGGILLYAIFSLVIICVAYAINKKPSGFIMLAIGIIGAVLAFMRMS